MQARRPTSPGLFLSSAPPDAEIQTSSVTPTRRRFRKVRMDQPLSPLRCPGCQHPLEAGRALGLCPRCLLARAAFATEADPDLTPPTAPDLDTVAAAFPQLEIQELIGRGGMGVVYRARQKSLNRSVALKLLAPGRERDPAFAERFAREARALAALNHPNIVTVHDFGFAPTTSAGQPGGFYFLLMEYVDGVNLRQAMQAGRFTPEQALAIVPPVCAALQFAHERGIVHRDIKPENLLLDKDGRIKIADFGIARILSDAPSESGTDHPQSGSTSNPGPSFTAHSAAGTPQYMAPEQRDPTARSDHRADIYSLGVVLYELLTGELPGARLQPPSSKVQIDVRLDEIVLRALAVQPELRYATAAEFRTQLDSVTARPTPSTPSAAQPSAVPRLLKTGGALIHTPEELATFYGQFWAMRNRGQLILDELRLTHVLNGTPCVIPLETIRDVSIGQYPRAMNPVGLDVLSVTHEVDGQLRQRFIAPMEGWFSWPADRSARIAEWQLAIRNAVARRTGREPGFTPRALIQVPPSHPALAAALIAAFLLPILLVIVSASVGGRGPGLPFIAAYVTGFIAFLLAASGRGGSRQSSSGEDAPSPPTRPWGRIIGILLLLAGITLPIVISGRISSSQHLETTRLQRKLQIAQLEESRLQQFLFNFPAPKAGSDPDANLTASEIMASQYARQLAATSEHRQNLERSLGERLPRSPRWLHLLPSLPLFLAGTLLLIRPRGSKSSVPPRRWMHWSGAACLVLGAPLLAFGVWIGMQVANDSSWNPAPGEAVLAFTTWIGSVLLVGLGAVLLALSRPHASHSWRIILPLASTALIASFALAGLLNKPRFPPGFATAPPQGVHRLAIEPQRQDGNRIVVRIVASVLDNPVQLRVALDGPTLPDSVLGPIAIHSTPPFAEAHSGQPSGNRPVHIFPKGDHVWEVALLFPNEAAAVETYRNLQSQEWSRPGLGTLHLFETVSSDGRTYRAHIDMVGIQTMGSPNRVSVTGRPSMSATSLRLNWYLATPSSGQVQFALGSRLSSVPTALPLSSAQAIQVNIDELSEDRVRIQTILPGKATTFEVPGDYSSIVRTVLGSVCWSAHGSESDLFELCRIQGEPLQMRIHPTPSNSAATPRWRLILTFLPLLVLVTLIGLVLALIVGGRARKTATVLGILLLLLLVPAMLIGGYLMLSRSNPAPPSAPVPVELHSR